MPCRGSAGTIYAPAAQLVESGNAQVGSTTNPISIIVDTLTISGNAIANALSLSSPAGTVAYSPAQIRAAYGINNLALDGTGQTIAIVDAYDDPSHLPGPGRVRHPVRADVRRPDALRPVRPGFVVLDGPQPERPGHVAARNRPERARHRQLGSRGSARRRVGPRHRARRADHPRRGQ